MDKSTLKAVISAPPSVLEGKLNYASYGGKPEPLAPHPYNAVLLATSYGVYGKITNATKEEVS